MYSETRVVSTQLERLKDALQRAQDNTIIMKDKIFAFESRLARLEHAMKPVKYATRRLTTARKKVGMTLSVVERMTEYFRIADDVQEILNRGLQKTGSASGNDFFEAVDRLSTARTFFEEHKEIKSASKALARVESVLKRAITICIQELEICLFDCGPLIEISNGTVKAKTDLSGVDMLRIMTICECVGNSTKGMQFDVYAESRIEQAQRDISAIYDSMSASSPATARASHAIVPVLSWISLYQELPYDKGSHPFHKYYQVVIAAIRGELELWSQSLSACQYSTLVEWWKDSDGVSIDGDGDDDDGDTNGSESDIRGSNHHKSLYALQAREAFGRICEAIIDGMGKLLMPLLQISNGGDSLSASQGRGLKANTVGKAGRDLKKKHAFADSSDHSTNTLRETNLLFIRMDLLAVLNSKFAELMDTVRLQLDEENKASRALGNIRDVLIIAAVDSISTVIDTVRSDNAESLGIRKTKTKRESIDIATRFSSCDMSPATGHVISCCQEAMNYRANFAQLAELAEAVGVDTRGSPRNAFGFTKAIQEALLASLSEAYQEFEAEDNSLLSSSSASESARSRSSGVGGSNRRISLPAAGGTAHQLAAAHSHALYEGGERLANERLLPACKHLYMANNLSPLYVFLKNSTASWVGGGGSSTNSNTRDRESQQLRLFMESIREQMDSELAKFADVVYEATGLSNVMHELGLAGDPRTLAAGGGKLLKVKFGQFNATMEALLTHQGEWRASSPELRESVATQLISRIMPTYTTFYETYSKVNFSKRHMDQYLRFPPIDVEKILNIFFR